MKRNRDTIIVAALCLILSAYLLCAAVTASSDGPFAPIRFAVIGDRAGSPVLGIYEQVVAEIQRLRPDFVVTVGDMIVGHTDDIVVQNARFDEYKRIIAELSTPLHYTPGNNEIGSDIFVWIRYFGRFRRMNR